MCSSSQVLNLKVRCSRHNDGCQWVGALRLLFPHEREECEWAKVECSYKCGAHLPRRQMVEHQRDVCPQRSIDARLERMEERHKREMKKMETRLNIERENEMAEYKQELIALRECLQKVKRMHASSSPHRTW